MGVAEKLARITTPVADVVCVVAAGVPAILHVDEERPALPAAAVAMTPTPNRQLRPAETPVALPGLAFAVSLLEVGHVVEGETLTVVIMSRRPKGTTPFPVILHPTTCVLSPCPY